MSTNPPSPFPPRAIAEALPSAPAARSRRRRALVPLLVLLGVSLFTAAVFFNIWAARLDGEPAWWRRVDDDAPRTKVLAQDVESRVLSAASRVRPQAAAPSRSSVAAAPADDAAASAASVSGHDGYRSEEWILGLSQNEANAWLATSLHAWLASLDRPGIGGVQVAFAADGIFIGVRDRAGPPSSSGPASEGGRIYWAKITPRADRSGVHLRLQGGGIGRIEVGAARLSTLADALIATHADGPERASLKALLAGDEVTVAERGFSLADGRRVRVIGVNALAGELRLTLITEKSAAGVEQK